MLQVASGRTQTSYLSVVPLEHYKLISVALDGPLNQNQLHACVCLFTGATQSNYEVKLGEACQVLFYLMVEEILKCIVLIMTCYIL